MKFRRFSIAVVGVVVAVSTGSAMSLDDIPLTNWPVQGVSGGRSPLGLGDADVFVGIPPCRQYDSRGSEGPLADSTPRAVQVTGAPCNIPQANIYAVSLNITVFDITGAGSNGVFKVGTNPPPPPLSTAWINYPPTETQRANAGILPTNGSQIWVQVNQGAGSVNFTVDVNGYFVGKDATIPGGSSGGWLEVRGAVNPNGSNAMGVIYAINSSTQKAYSIKTDITNAIDDSAALSANETATTGRTYGILATNSSVGTDSAGVLSRASAQLPTLNFNSGPAGLRGESSATAAGAAGVLGIGRNSGVYGVNVNSSGQSVTSGVLGHPSYGVYYTNGLAGMGGTKNFIEPHPTDPTKVIRYASLEGPEAGTYFRGRGIFRGREAVILVPEHFRFVTDPDSLTVHVTPMGGPALAWVAYADLYQVILYSTEDVEFSYIVHGVRRAYRDFQVIVEGADFVPASPSARIPAWLSEDEKRRLIENGTYNEDGSVNLRTAERLGWFSTAAGEGDRR